MTTGTIAQAAQPAGLKARVIRAGSWIMGGTFVAQALSTRPRRYSTIRRPALGPAATA